LNQSSLIVGLLSPDAVASRNVKNEWDWAIQNKKQLILLMTRPCAIPHRYISINFIEAPPDNLSTALAALMQVPGLPSRAAALPVPRTRYARSGDINIAYQEFGEGNVDLVFVPGYVSHVEHLWKLPAMATFLRRLASFSRVMLFDKRGTGMSDRIGRIATLEERMDDIRAVMDACKSEHAAIMGVSEGGPLSLLFAATHPSRTKSLIVYGGRATYVQHADYPWMEPSEKLHQELDATEKTLFETWGTVESALESIRLRAPSAVNNVELVSWFAELQRLGASPGAEIARQRMNLEIDVRHILRAVHVPTLVLNRLGDQSSNIGEARYIAERIPDAVLVELPGDAHLPWEGDQDALFSAIEQFIEGIALPEPVPAPEQETVLATVVHLASDGMDRGALKAAAAKEIKRFRGRMVTRSNSGVDAIFDGPARAIHFAHAMSSATGRGDSMRIGIQIGEVELSDLGPSSPPFESARHLAESAQPQQIVVTGLVRDLVAGSGIRFDCLPDGQAVSITDVPVALVVNQDSLT
jgi:pimeloyl-ACP methyl ester carboxylesterase